MAGRRRRVRARARSRRDRHRSGRRVARTRTGVRRAAAGAPGPRARRPRPTSTSCAPSPARFPTAGSRAPRTRTRARAIPNGRRGTRSRSPSGAGSRRSRRPDWAPAPAPWRRVAPEEEPHPLWGDFPTRASSRRSGTLTGHGVRATGGRDAPGGATVAGVRRRRDGARRRLARARSSGPCGVPAAGRLQRDRRRELPDGKPAQRVGHHGRRRHEHPGLRDRHVGQPRRDRQLQGRARRPRATGSTSTGWATTAATARARSRRSARRASLPQNQPACLTNSSGLVDCGNWGVSASWAVPASAVSGIYFAHLVRTDVPSGRQPRLLRRAQRRLAVGHLLPDVRHHVAGLQRLRRQQPLRAAARCRAAAPPARRWSATTGPSSRARSRAARTGSSTPSTRWSAGWSATATTSATRPASTPTASGR